MLHSITYKIAYALSNTHHIKYFAQKDYIDLPLLFHDIGRTYPPENSSITFKDDFLLDIGDKPKYIDHRPSCSRLSLTNNTIHLSKMVTFKSLEQNKKITNYKIKGDYFDGLDWKTIDILIVTPRENPNFLKNGKMVILIKIRNYSRSQKTKWTSALEWSHEI